MFVVESYGIAVVLCLVTMVCWGSWANAQKLVGAKWRFELFYWDYVLGMLLAALVFAATLGSFGHAGRSFLADLGQATPVNLGWAILGGVVFNAANILLVAAIDLAGMAVAFPVGIGLALVLGVLVAYWAAPAGNPMLLALGVALIAVAIVLDALAYRAISGQQKRSGAKGLILAILCGILMASFYSFVATAMSKDFVQLEAGKLSPYTAFVLFALGVAASNLVFNTAIMVKPFRGEPVPLSAYFRGTANDHLWGVVGGAVWAVGMMLSIVAAGKAGFPISYGLGQGATMVAAFWGVFVWKEFRDAPTGTGRLIGLMFAGYIMGLALVVIARVV
ncbi:MAG: GRP family sugar transporter [Thermoguttaceae bacterium]|jgi:glucose uptake protein